MEGVVTLKMPRGETPKLKDLQKLLTPYCSLWRDIGLQLGLKSVVLDQVAADHSKTRDCFRVTLEKWLQLNVAVTWGDLELAITNANRQSLGYDPLTSIPRSCLQSDDNHNGQIDKQQYDQREQDQRRRDDQRRQDNQKRQDDQRRKEDNVNGSRILAFSDERCSTTNWCSYKQMKTKNGTEITLIIGKDEMKFRINKTGGVIGDELEREVFDCYYRTEKTLKWHSIEEVISIFERLVIFLYNGAIAIGHIEFQQEIKTLITELVSTYEKGIKMMQQYQVMFCAVLRNEGKPEYKQNVYYIFYEGFEQLSHIFIQVSDAHEKLTDLQKALDEAAKLTQYNECVIESLQITVSCCIDGIQLLCECSRKCLQKRLERPVHKATNSALEDLSRSVEGIAFIFVAIERFQMLIEISERTIQNINKEIHKTITVDMAKGMVRKTIFTIPSLKSLFEYHHEKFKKMSILDYLD